MITENAVYSDEVTIHAPVELVWEILLDFESYSEWNTFCPQAANDSLELGTPIEMMVNLGQGLARQVEYISCVKPLECIAWAMENKPGDPVHAERSQRLKRIDDESCSYISLDEFSGPEAPAMMEHFAGIVEDGFNRCAQDLKKYAEERCRKRSAGTS
ncbi:MAG: SRPBCC domain-containing protein [Halioglobus sp.]